MLPVAIGRIVNSQGYVANSQGYVANSQGKHALHGVKRHLFLFC
jgi:hypothetical protein